MSRYEDFVVTRLNVKEIYGNPGLPEDTISIGEDDNGVDIKFYGATADSYMLWDESADTLVFEGADLRLNDSDYLVFGDDSDARMTWNGSYMEGPNPGSGMWADCPSAAYADPSLAFHYFEDFIGLPLDSSDEPTQDWYWWEDAGATTAVAAGTTGGELTLTPNAVSDNAAGMMLGHANTTTIVEIVKNSGKKLWFETRIKVNAVSNGYNNFWGLTEEGAAADNFINDAGNDYADVDVLGFVVWEGDGDALDINHQLKTGAFAKVGNTIVLDTSYHTYGIYFDGVETISFYIDGTIHGATADVDTATFPTDEELTVHFHTKCGSVTNNTMTIDYVKLVAQR